MINRPLAGPLLPRSPGRRHGRASRRSRPSAITRLASSVGSQSLRAPVRTARPSMSASSPDAPPVVDVHAHLVPERAFERVPAGMRAERVEGADEIRLAVHGPRGAGRGAPPELRDLELHRRRQQRRGIGLSLVGPWIDMVKAPDEPALQQAWCRVLNEELAAATGASGHSRWLAALPDLDGARAGQELERAAAAGAVGGMLAANPEHGTLARSDLEWLWRAAERLRLPLVLHPGEFKPPPRLAEHFMVNLVGNPFETTTAAASSPTSTRAWPPASSAGHASASCSDAPPPSCCAGSTTTPWCSTTRPPATCWSWSATIACSPAATAPSPWRTPAPSTPRSGSASTRPAATACWAATPRGCSACTMPPASAKRRGGEPGGAARAGGHGVPGAGGRGPGGGHPRPRERARWRPHADPLPRAAGARAAVHHQPGHPAGRPRRAQRRAGGRLGRAERATDPRRAAARPPGDGRGRPRPPAGGAAVRDHRPAAAAGVRRLQHPGHAHGAGRRARLPAVGTDPPAGAGRRDAGGDGGQPGVRAARPRHHRGGGDGGAGGREGARPQRAGERDPGAGAPAPRRARDPGRGRGRPAGPGLGLQRRGRLAVPRGEARWRADTPLEQLMIIMVYCYTIPVVPSTHARAPRPSDRRPQARRQWCARITSSVCSP